MTDETNTPVAASNDAAPAPANYGGDHTGLRAAARDLTKARGEEESEPVTPTPPEGDGSLSPRQAASALSKWRAESEADRVALDEALGLNAPAEDASEQQETPLVEHEKLVAAQAEFEKATEEVTKLRDEIREQLAESTKTQAQLHGAVADAVQLFAQEFQRAYPELRTQGDFAALRVSDPARAAQAEADLQRANIELANLNQYQQRGEQQAQQSFRAWAEHEDRAFAKRFEKELADPKVRTELTNAALEMLQAEGFSHDQIARAWNGGGVVPLRSAAVQAIMLDAARYRLSRQKIKSGKPRPAVPPVQRPGVAPRAQRLVGDCR